MLAWRRLARPLLVWARRWLWYRPVAAPVAHTPAQLGAWEAELTAYAHWRTGNPTIKVRFGLSTGGGWAEEVQLRRPTGGHPPAQVLAAAEVELEHLLAHYCYGWRELTLLWHAWGAGAAPITLPWPPWDRVGLPPAVIRLALAEAVPALALPPAREASPGRQRSAALWLAAAWADGVHVPSAIAERPGLAVRLPSPSCPRRPDLWETVLYRLAAPDAGRVPDGSLPADVAAGLDRLRGVGAADVEAHVPAVLSLLDVLSRRGAVPVSHRQRPAWLRPAWGRWQREGPLRQALDRLARSPSSAAVATATAAGRHHGPSGSLGRGGPGAPSSPVQATLSRSGDPAAAEGLWGVQAESEAPPATAWGAPDDETLPEQVQDPAVDSRAVGREGQGAAGGGQSGTGPGVLGALHVVQAGAADRAAYWQLRGALAPQIERLIDALRAGDDGYYAHVPRRFQRSGRLDRRRLPATAAGRERVFVRFVHQPEPAHALCLLLDCSASMTTRAERVREMAIVVESATAAVGARVSAFTFGAAWERMEPAADAGPLDALGRQLHPHGGTPFGPAVVAAAEWLAGQPYARKRLWVFSDGQWSARDRAAPWRPSLLQDAVFWVLGDRAPEPLTPGMRIAPVATVAELVQLAPAHFWATSDAQRPAVGDAQRPAVSDAQRPAVSGAP